MKQLILRQKLEHNNKALRDTAKKNLDDSKENEVKGAIKNHIMPMIENKLPILTKLILVISMLIMQGKRNRNVLQSAELL